MSRKTIKAMRQLVEAYGSAAYAYGAASFDCNPPEERAATRKAYRQLVEALVPVLLTANMVTNTDGDMPSRHSLHCLAMALRDLAAHSPKFPRRLSKAQAQAEAARLAP